MDDNYGKELHIKAAPRDVFRALTTLDGCSAWWAAASGSAAAGGELRFTFDDPNSPLMLRVMEAEPATRVVWHVLGCEFLPDWTGTTLTFGISSSHDGSTDLRFLHDGLSPRLECFDTCQAGWNYYLPSLRDYAESGAGRPYPAGG
jgi:uncharacterized protein YndB with AHSA1/START domain